MIRIHNRVKVGLTLLQYFTMRAWNFSNKKFMETTKKLTEKELDVFYLANVTDVDVDLYFKHAILGSRQFILKDPLSTLPRARRILKL